MTPSPTAVRSSVGPCTPGRPISGPPIWSSTCGTDCPASQLLPDVEQVLARRWFLLAILGALNLLDLVTTKLVLHAGGAEANPIMAPIIHHPFAPALVKTCGFVMVAMVLKACPARSKMVDRALVTVTGLYLAIVTWNLLNLLLNT